MSSDRDREERLFDELLAQEDPREAFERSKLSGDPRHRAQFEELMDMQNALEAAGRESREEIRAAGSLVGAPGEDRVAEVIAGLARSEGPGAARRTGPRPVWWRLAPWLGLAAALLLALVWLRGGGENGRTILGPGGAVRGPEGAVAAWAELAWEVDVARPGWYDLQLADEDGDVLVEHRHLEDSSWTPDASDLESLAETERIRWRVDLYDGSSSLPEDFAEGSVERSSSPGR